MYLTHMRPEQIRDAVARDVPLVMAAGVIEYHGPHLPVGTDFLIAEAVVGRLEKACECVVAPSLPYGPTMEWAGKPEDGEIDFDPDIFLTYAREALRRLMRMGFRRIYAIQQHQGEDGIQRLSLRLAAVDLLREAAQSYGAKWGWGDYEKLPHPNFFTWIQIGPVDGPPWLPRSEHGKVPMGHAGMGETQLIWAGYPETVRMEALGEMAGPCPEWLLDSDDADPEEGRKWLDYCVELWKKELTRKVF